MPERDVDALAGALDRLVRDPDAWRRLGEAGRAHIERGYNVHRTVSQLENYYDDLTGPVP